MEKYGTEIIKIDGITFRIGYLLDSEFSGYVFEMKKNGEWHGMLWVNESKREIGWNSGIMATEAEITAISKAREILYEKYGKGRYHG